MLTEEFDMDIALEVRYEEGMERGRLEGIEKGIERGRLEGREEGRTDLLNILSQLGASPELLDKAVSAIQRS